ncbi:MAG: HAD family hydrolase [Oscillospiraceae bacterium]
MHKYYILDMDGTLCDSMYYWRNMFSLYGGGLPECLEFMRRNYTDVIRLKPGVTEFIANAHSRGIITCIASATTREIAQPFLDRTGLMRGMAFYVDCAQLALGKRDPQFYIKVAEMLGADISECVVFEDAYYCAESAKKAGFYTVGVLDHVTSKEGDLSAYCDVTVENIGDFCETEALAT